MKEVIDMGFTFYGDLLGISSMYRLAPQRAYERLNDFYNTTFSSIEEQWAAEDNLETIMFSDSLLIYGDNPESALERLSVVYMKLHNEGLLFRGAMVKGRIAFEPRMDRHNFRNMIPTNDTLARAVILESAQKGARLIVENRLAQDLLQNVPEWATHDGYVRKPNLHDVPRDHILRRLSPTPDNMAYEVLYFWICHPDLTDLRIDYKMKKEEFEEIQKGMAKNVGDHYRATIDLLERCESRQRFTDKRLRQI